MKKEIKAYYEAAQGVLEMDDKYLEGYIKECKKAIRLMGDEIKRLEYALYDVKSDLDEYQPCEWDVLDNDVIYHAAKDRINKELKICEE